MVCDRFDGTPFAGSLLNSREANSRKSLELSQTIELPVSASSLSFLASGLNGVSVRQVRLTEQQHGTVRVSSYLSVKPHYRFGLQTYSFLWGEGMCKSQGSGLDNAERTKKHHV